MTVGKFSSKFLKHFFTSSISFLPNSIFLVSSFIFRFVYILGTHRLQKEDQQNQSNLEATRRCFVRKDVLKNVAKFIGKHLCQSLFCIKMLALICNFIKNETLAQLLSCEFCEISKNAFFKEHLWATASVRCFKTLKCSTSPGKNFLKIKDTLPGLAPGPI